MGKKSIAINDVAPDFSLEDWKGQVVRLSDYRGKNVVLVFNRGFL